jgi:hypothetical protein
MVLPGTFSRLAHLSHLLESCSIPQNQRLLKAVEDAELFERPLASRIQALPEKVQPLICPIHPYTYHTEYAHIKMNATTMNATMNAISHNVMGRVVIHNLRAHAVF